MAFPSLAAKERWIQMGTNNMSSKGQHDRSQDSIVMCWETTLLPPDHSLNFLNHLVSGWQDGIQGNKCTWSHSLSWFPGTHVKSNPKRHGRLFTDQGKHWSRPWSRPGFGMMTIPNSRFALLSESGLNQPPMIGHICRCLSCRRRSQADLWTMLYNVS